MNPFHEVGQVIHQVRGRLCRKHRDVELHLTITPAFRVRCLEHPDVFQYMNINTESSPYKLLDVEFSINERQEAPFKVWILA